MQRTTERSIVLVALVATACEGRGSLPTDLGPVPDGAFTTDATGYVALPIGQYFGHDRYSFTIVARFENRGATPLYIARCFPTSPSPIFGVTRTDLLGKTSGFNTTWGCVGVSHMIAVAPGAYQVDTLTMTGPNLFDGVTHEPLNGPLEGRYRLSYDVRVSDGETAPAAPFGAGSSNEFVVRLSP
jgi:hypothetical protein